MGDNGTAGDFEEMVEVLSDVSSGLSCVVCDLLPSHSWNGFDMAERDRKGFGFSANTPWNGFVGGRDLDSVGDNLAVVKGLIKGLFAFRTGRGESCGDLGDCDIGLLTFGDRDGVWLLEVVIRPSTGDVMDFLVIASSTLEWCRVVLSSDGDGSITRSSLPWSDHEKWVTVTGVVQRFCDSLLLSSVSSCEVSSLCAPSCVAVVPTAAELAPPRAKVSLSPPWGNVHKKQVTPTHGKHSRKKTNNSN